MARAGVCWCISAERQEKQTPRSRRWQSDGDGESRAGGTQDCPADEGDPCAVPGCPVVVAEPGQETGTNLSHANDTQRTGIRARCKLGLRSPNTLMLVPALGLGGSPSLRGGSLPPAGVTVHRRLRAQRRGAMAWQPWEQQSWGLSVRLSQRCSRWGVR